jgi:hypothetical protein
MIELDAELSAALTNAMRARRRRARVSGGGGFDPASLFAAGEQGAWYDPSDLTTLFQDTAGATPVTAAGQSVALVRNKSQSRRNLFIRSEEFDSGSWPKAGGASVTANAAVAPDGTTTADQFNVDGVNSWARVFSAFADSPTLVAGQSYVVSCYAKAGTGTVIGFEGAVTTSFSPVTFNLTTGARISGSAGSSTALPDGWFRFEIPFVAGGSGKIEFRINNPSAPSASNILIWGAQFELGTVATKYQRIGANPTTPLIGAEASQATAGDRPLYQNDGRGYLSNVSTDFLTASMPNLGTTATLAYCDTNGVTILSNQTITGATTLPTSTRLYWAIYLDRALTESERVALISYGGDYVADFYANSALGSDSYDGKSPGRPFATISKLQTEALAKGNGANVGLARGSSWREYLNLSTLTGAKVFGYGPNGSTSAALPKLDCANVAANANFTKTGGLTNVYQISWTHSIASDIGKRKLRAWVGGQRLKWVASQALCDAEAGTFHVPTGSIANPATIYIHSTGSTNPISDAKLYEITSREYALTVGGSYDVRYVHTTRNAHHDGSFVGPVDSGAAGYGEGILSTDGVVHNQWVSVGSTHVNCVAYGMEPSSWRGLNGTLFVTFRSTGSTATTVYRGCYAYSDAPTGEAHTSFYAHTLGGANRLARVTIEGCRVYGNNPTIGAADTDAMDVVDTLMELLTSRSSSASHINASTGALTLNNLTVLNGARVVENASSLSVTDMRYYTAGSVSGGVFWPANCTIRNSSFAFTKAAAQADRIMFNTTGSAAVYQDNVVQNGSFSVISAPTAEGISSDRNVLWNENAAISNAFNIRSPVQNISFAAWQTATGEDANTSYTNSEAAPIFTDAPNGDFTSLSGVVNTGGRTAGSRKTIARPNWSALVTAWQSGQLGI